MNEMTVGVGSRSRPNASRWINTTGCLSKKYEAHSIYNLIDNGFLGHFVDIIGHRRTW
jgi:hypothetical protein